MRATCLSNDGKGARRRLRKLWRLAGSGNPHEARLASLRASALQRRLEEEQIMISQEVIDQLKAANAGTSLHLLEVEEDEAIFRMPTPGEWRRFMTISSDRSQQATAGGVLAHDCRVYPSPELFDAMLNRRPGLADSFGNKLCEVAGLVKGSEVRAKKL